MMPRAQAIETSGIFTAAYHADVDQIAGYAVRMGVALFALVGFCSFGTAEFNLVGVPMLEPNDMSPSLGWLALVVGTVSLALAYWLLRCLDGESTLLRRR